MLLPGTIHLDKWFAARGWKPFPFQRRAWQAYGEGRSGLIHAATGMGKTYSALFGPVLAWMAEHKTSWPKSVPLQMLWITPLRALAADTEKSIERAFRELELPWTVGRRTGDTSAAARAKQRERLPSLLITTPESLSVLLSYPDAREKFASLQAVVVDEWHELMGSKRGVQTELGLAQLRAWHPELRTWGLSATLGNLHRAMQVLLGPNKDGVFIEGESRKRIEIDSLIPAETEHFPWAGHLGLRMLTQVVNAIDEGKTCLVFTNTRSFAEIWYQALLEARPDWAGLLALHHGSLERETREWVESAIREGRLRCVVATSSLDLGVDFSPVDRVIQIGSPRGVARLLQRAGRSGHQPGQTSRVTCSPSNAFELLEFAATRTAAAAGRIEAREPIEKPLDLLAQHLVTIGCGPGFVADEMPAALRQTHAYRNLTDEEWAWTLDFAARGGKTLQAYDQYHRLMQDEQGVYRVRDQAIARRHRLGIGTITSDASIAVKYANGETLGTIEETFIAGLSPGDIFVFAGRTLEFKRMREMVAVVKRAPDSARGIVPRWMGGRIPLSNELAQAVREKIEAAAAGGKKKSIEPELAAIRPVLDVQSRWSHIPARDELLIERMVSREGFHLFLYPFSGKLVHDGLAALFALRISRLQPISFSIAGNDYGFELLSPEPAPLEPALERGLLSLDNLSSDLLETMNAAELARRQFREVTRVAGLVFQGYPGQGKTNKQLQSSAGLLFDVFMRFDPENLLLKQAQREVLTQALERGRMEETLLRLQQTRIVVRDIDRPTPFAFPLLVDRLREKLSSEKLADRIRKMTGQLEEIVAKEMK
jgi:ATP-dependent Lhr-like helicase